MKRRGHVLEREDFGLDMGTGRVVGRYRSVEASRKWPTALQHQKGQEIQGRSKIYYHDGVGGGVNR